MVKNERPKLAKELLSDNFTDFKMELSLRFGPNEGIIDDKPKTSRMVTPLQVD